MTFDRKGLARLLLALMALAASAAAVASFAQALSEFRQYLALRVSDRSGAEVYLDGAYIWGAGFLASAVVVAICAFVARRSGRSAELDPRKVRRCP